MRGEGKHDGVFSLLVRQGSGVDRSGDVFRHANLAGTSKYGGVLLMGDDHTAESSTTAHQSEFNFVNVMMPWCCLRQECRRSLITVSMATR